MHLRMKTNLNKSTKEVCGPKILVQMHPLTVFPILKFDFLPLSGLQVRRVGSFSNDLSLRKFSNRGSQTIFQIPYPQICIPKSFEKKSKDCFYITFGGKT